MFGNMTEIPIEKIDRAADTQPRAHVDDDVIKEYLEKIQNGVALPAIDLFGPYGEDDMHAVGDGWIRLAAFIRAGYESVPAKLHPGGERDARIFACGANATHGARRTTADKRRAVTMLLEDNEWSGKSSRAIADHCHVSHWFVDKIREERAEDDQVAAQPPDTRTGKDGKEYPAEAPAPRAKQEPTERPEKAAKSKKSGSPKESAQLRRETKATWGAFVRQFDVAKKEGQMPAELVEGVEFWIHEMSEALAEWWGKGAAKK